MVSSLLLAGCVFGGAAMHGQAAAGAQQPQQQSSGLQLQKLGDQQQADPFPPANPKLFTATSPTTDTVNSFLKSLWGYDANRIWKVAAIQKTDAPGVSKVVVYVAERGANAKVQLTQFFVTPDGKHAIADGTVTPFGATPFADLRQLMQQRADGPARGAAGKDLLIVEFADLQCPHCKEAQPSVDQLMKDFPNARFVFENFPLSEIHPAAFLAAAYGVCVAQQKSDAFFPYVQAVFDTQASLTEDQTKPTLAAAVTKVGLDPAAVATCAAAPATVDKVNASLKLGEDAGVDQTPLLIVNGHILPASGMPYETLKQIVQFQAQQDGVSTGAAK